MSENVVNQIHTSCKGCFFSEWSGKTQTGCSAKLLKSYEDYVLPVIDEEQDEFFVINGRHCNFKRPRIWGHAFKGRISEAIKKARKELCPKVELVVYLDKFDKDSFKVLNKTIESGVKQTSPISAITVINNTENDPLSLSTSLSNFVSNYSIPWKIKNIIEAEATPNRCFDLAVKESKYTYFLYCVAGYKVPNVITKLDKLINDKMEQIVAIGLGREEEPVALIGQTFVYKLLQGNAGDFTFWQKLVELEKEENKKIIRRESEL